MSFHPAAMWLMVGTYDCFHAGLDIYRDNHAAGSSDTTFDAPVFAAADGRVVAILDWESEGHGVLVTHEGTRYVTHYAHFQTFVVREGQPVRRGQFLGRLMDYPRNGWDHVALLLPAPATSKVFKVTARRGSGNGVVQWLELGPILVRP